MRIVMRSHVSFLECNKANREGRSNALRFDFSLFSPSLVVIAVSIRYTGEDHGFSGVIHQEGQHN